MTDKKFFGEVPLSVIQEKADLHLEVNPTNDRVTIALSIDLSDVPWYLRGALVSTLVQLQKQGDLL